MLGHAVYLREVSARVAWLVYTSTLTPDPTLRLVAMDITTSLYEVCEAIDYINPLQQFTIYDARGRKVQCAGGGS